MSVIDPLVCLGRAHDRSREEEMYVKMRRFVIPYTLSLIAYSSITKHGSILQLKPVEEQAKIKIKSLTKEPADYSRNNS